MTKYGLAAILALSSTAAFAGSFEIPISGGLARINVDENCRGRVCASVSWQERAGGERHEFRLPEISKKTIKKMIDNPRWGAADDDDEPPAPKRKSPAPQAYAPEPAPAPAPTPAPQAYAPEPAPAPAPTPAPQAYAPTPAPAPAPQITTVAPPPPAAAPSVAVAPEPRVAAVAPQPEPAPAPVQQAARNTPVGEWLVEDGEGRIRIEECGANLCGYVSAAKNPNDKDRKNPDPSLRNRSVIGMPVLINMKPAGNRWNGRIYNVKDGGTYTANIALKSPDRLRVEGCAFGGLVCGGQTWTRAN